MMRKLKNIGHLILALIANIWYGFPARKIKVIGVTGTDGKTTTSHLIFTILKTAGKKVSLVSTVYAQIGEKVYDTGLHTTTPSYFLIQKLLREAVNNSDEYFILETTSHGLDQNRVWGINYQVGVITNITHEHLDYHLYYADLLKAKAKLLINSQISIINHDDQSFELLKKLLIEKKKKYLTYGFKSKTDYNFNTQKILPETADYNNYNFLAAYSVCRSLNIGEDKIIQAFKNFNLPQGRLETVFDKKFKVIVDFAHTPNAIAVLLQFLKKQTKGRIIHVFGSAGLRDANKRPLMGKASSKYSDLIILTEEDYRTEDPQEIAKSIAQGFTENMDYQIIINREEAIKKALSLAQADDLVVITGKAHEQSLCRGKTEYPWNDIAAVKRLTRDL